MKKFKTIVVDNIRNLSFKKTVKLPGNMHRIVGALFFIQPDDITGYYTSLGSGFDNLGKITLQTIKGNLIETFPVGMDRIFDFDIDVGLHIITRKLNMLNENDIIPITVDDLYLNDQLTIIFDHVDTVPEPVTEAIGTNNYDLKVILEYE